MKNILKLGVFSAVLWTALVNTSFASESSSSSSDLTEIRKLAKLNVLSIGEGLAVDKNFFDAEKIHVGSIFFIKNPYELVAKRIVKIEYGKKQAGEAKKEVRSLNPKDLNLRLSGYLNSATTTGKRDILQIELEAYPNDTEHYTLEVTVHFAPAEIYEKANNK